MEPARNRTPQMLKRRIVNLGLYILKRDPSRMQKKSGHFQMKKH